jgi:CHRD domain-containing protein
MRRGQRQAFKQGRQRVTNKYWLVVLTLLTVTIAAITAAAADGAGDTVVLRAVLRGKNETPPIATEATGSFRATIDGDGTVSFRLAYTNLSEAVTQAHIHFAQKNVPGGIMIFLCGAPSAADPGAWPVCPDGTSGVLEGTITTRQVVAIPTQGIDAGDLAVALRAIGEGEGYANVHSMRFPGGEIRGQVGVRIPHQGHGNDHDDEP